MGRVAKAEDRGGRGRMAKCGEDGRLQAGEGFVRERFGLVVAGDGNVYYAAGSDGRWEEDRRELDL